MAGSISLSLSQQLSSQGLPLGGGLLNFYTAGTTTPQNAFQDTALTIPYPNPITLDAAGRVPQFYLADGQIKIRLTDKYGNLQLAADNVLVIGPSDGGGGGGGGGVDPTTVFQTGDCLWLPALGSRTGWVRSNGRTIGSSTSGASERANADAQALFIYLWNNYSDSICPVGLGRGVSGLADFQANKQIQLLDLRGRVPGGLDDMGNTAASRYASAPVISGGVTTPGAVLGENLHQLSKAELPTDKPTGTVAITDPGHTHSYVALASGSPVAQGSGAGSVTSQTGSSTTGITAAFSGDPLGSGTAHNVLQQTMLGTFYHKL